MVLRALGLRLGEIYSLDLSILRPHLPRHPVAISSRFRAGLDQCQRASTAELHRKSARGDPGASQHLKTLRLHGEPSTSWALIRPRRTEMRWSKAWQATRPDVGFGATRSLVEMGALGGGEFASQVFHSIAENIPLIRSSPSSLTEFERAILVDTQRVPQGWTRAVSEAVLELQGFNRARRSREVGSSTREIGGCLWNLVNRKLCSQKKCSICCSIMPGRSENTPL